MTDPDSRIMKTRTGYVQGYNGQVLVSNLTQEENDCRQLHQIGALAADAGYWSEANCARCDPGGPELFVATTFGQVKVVRGCDRFIRWGHSACRSEWRLIWATHNLLKLWRHFLVRWGKARGLLCPHRVGPAWAA